MNNKRKKCLKIGLLTTFAAAACLAFGLTIKNNNFNKNNDDKNDFVIVDGKKLEKKTLNFKNTMFVSKSQNMIFKNRNELEEYINKNLKKISVNSLLNENEFKQLQKENVAFLTNSELQNFDFSNSKLKTIKIYKGKNNSVHINENDAKKSYFNLQEFIKVGNFVAASKEDLFNYLIKNKDSFIDKKNTIDVFLETCETLLNKNDSNIKYIKTPDNNLTSINIDEFKKFENNDERNKILKELIEKHQKKMIVYLDPNQNKYVVKDFDKYLENNDQINKIVKESTIKLYSNQGRNKFIVDNSKEDPYDLFGPYTLSASNNYIYEIKNKNNWTKIDSGDKKIFIKNVKTQSAMDMISNLFTYIITLKITESKSGDLNKIHPLTDIFDNENNINPFKNSMESYQIERDNIKANLYDYLFDTYKRLHQGKKSSFLSNLYVLYVTGINSLIQIKAKQKDIIIFKEHFKRIFKEISKTLASLLPDVFEDDQISSKTFSKINFKKVNLFKEWNIFDFDFDLSSDIYRLVNPIAENKFAFNSLGLLLSALVNSQKLMGFAKFNGKEDLIIKDELSEEEKEYYTNVFEYYSFTSSKSGFIFEKNELKKNENPLLLNSKIYNFLSNFSNAAISSINNMEKDFNKYSDIMRSNLNNKSSLSYLLDSYYNGLKPNEKGNFHSFMDYSIKNLSNNSSKKSLLDSRLNHASTSLNSVRGIFMLLNKIQSDIVNCSQSPDEINISKAVIGGLRDITNIVLDFFPIPQAIIAKMIMNLCVDLILEMIGKNNYFDYEYKIDKGENSGIYIWNGGHSVVRFWGLLEEEKSTIENAKIITPIKYLDAQTKDEYYFNGARYSELDIEKMKKDIINYYKKNDIGYLCFENAIVFNTWNTNEKELEEKINNNFSVKEKMIKISDLQNLKDVELWFDANNQIEKIQNNNYNFGKNWVGKLFLTENGDSLTIPKRTDKHFKDLLLKLIENLELSYFTDLPIQKYDEYESSFYPIDQFENNKDNVFKNEFWNKIIKGDDEKFYIDDNNILKMNNPNMLIYPKPFKVKNNLQFWDDNLNLIKIFYKSFSVRSKNVSYIEYLRKNNYDEMGLLNQKSLYEFKVDGKKYYFLDEDKARQYIINTFFQISSYRYIAKTMNYYLFDGLTFYSIEEAKKYFASIKESD